MSRVPRRRFLKSALSAAGAAVAAPMIIPSSALGRDGAVAPSERVVVGGIGQIRGAVIAAFALGLLQSFTQWGTSASMAKVIVFIAIVVFLQVRPQGIVNVRTRSLA